MGRFLLLALCLLSATSALAGENIHLGTATMTGASITNVTTAVPFYIPPGAQVTIYCSAAGVQILTDSTVVSTGTLGTKGIIVPATTLFPTSVGKVKGVIGTQQTAVIAFIGTAAVTCDVWARLGTE